jgi:hypothetical protein
MPSGSPIPTAKVLQNFRKSLRENPQIVSSSMLLCSSSFITLSLPLFRFCSNPYYMDNSLDAVFLAPYANDEDN